MDQLWSCIYQLNAMVWGPPTLYLTCLTTWGHHWMRSWWESWATPWSCVWLMWVCLKIGNTHTGWWFQTLFIFHNIWDNPSHWPICFKIVKTTNQHKMAIWTQLMKPLFFWDTLFLDRPISCSVVGSLYIYIIYICIYII